MTGWASNAGVVWKKIVIFDKYLALSRKLYKIGSSLLWKASRNSCATAVYQMVLFPISLSGL